MKTTNHNQTPLAKHLVISALVAAALAAVLASSANATTRLGNPFTPAGANFSIYAEQVIDLTTGNGQGGVSPQVNIGFEDPDGIGVTRDTGNGLVDFGIGLYTPPPTGVTTGLKLLYNQNVLARSLTATLKDFDIMSNATDFNPNKVEPGILLLGTSGNVIANALPTDIHLGTSSSAFTFVSGSKTDTWTLSFSQLLSNLGMSDTAISGFVLYADATRGETVTSDPYFLVSATNGVTTVPESGTYLPGIAALVFALMFHVHRMCERKRVAVTR